MGGQGIKLSSVRGELVWDQGGEFKSGAWTNVPLPIGPSERRVAYVFRPTSDPTTPFSLPPAYQAVLDDVEGPVGFPFRYDTTLGNLTFYALAGLEDRSVTPPRFTPYAMGIVRGVSASPGETTSNVYIPINVRLDHRVEVTAKTPAAGSRGPDRAQFSVAIEIERGGYAILPSGGQTWVMPVDRGLSFVGLPALSGSLTGARYIASARAGTGPQLSAPLSEVGRFASTTESIALNAFVPVPALDAPTLGGPWDGRHLSIRFGPSATSIDVTVINIASGGGLVNWRIAAPGGTRSVTLPDLRALFPQGALVPGNVSVGVYGAHIEGFVYGSVRYGQLGISGFDAYALDVFPAHYE